MSFSKIFMAAIDGLSEGIWVIDYIRDRHFWFASEQNRAKYGLPNGDAPKDFWITNLHLEDRQRAMDGYQRALASKCLTAFEHEYRFKGANGHYMTIHDTMRFIRDDSGKVLQTVGTWKDVTAQRNTEALLRKVVDDQKPFTSFAFHDKGKLAIPTGEGLVFIYISDITYCKASSNYTEIFMADGSVFIVSRTLKEYENTLMPYGFVRIHHSSLINLAYLKKYVRGDGGYVVMKDNKVFDVSKRRRDGFLSTIENHFASLNGKYS